MRRYDVLIAGIGGQGVITPCPPIPAISTS